MKDDLTIETTEETTEYKGYLIHLFFDGRYYLSLDGKFFIDGAQSTIDEAKAFIDKLESIGNQTLP